MTSPQTHHRILKKIQSFNRQRSFRVAIIGQDGVGKSALTVRFLTRRFIGDYDPRLEKIYTCSRCVLGNTVEFEILDTAGQNENSKLKQHIKWSDAVILMYSVTDRCSFNEVRRLNFTITASSRRKHKSGSDPCQELAWSGSLPVLLVANQTDREMDRMVSSEEGQLLASELGCVSFTELSVREDIDAVMEVFEELFMAYRRNSKVKAGGGHLGWSVVSLERLALGHSHAMAPKEKGEHGGGGEEDEQDPQITLGVRARRREALIS